MTVPMKQKIVIASVADSNEPGLFDLLNGFLTTVGSFTLDEKAVGRLMEAIKKEKIFFYIARNPESAVGICSLTIGFSTYRASPFGLVDDFYIVAEMRRKGIARLLLDHVLSDARKKGCRSVILGCSTDDMPMYKHLGFRTIGNMMAKDLFE